MGTKAKIAKEIIPYFPPHEIYIELFFGAGGMFFNKPRAKQNFLNDIDDDIFNLFQVTENRKDELYNYIESLPYSESLFKHWKENKETDPIKKAGRFLYLSNFSFLGGGYTFHIICNADNKGQLLKLLKTYQHPIKTTFLNGDFSDVLGKIGDLKSFKQSAFIYADPPYIGTNGNYDAFTEEQTESLFDLLVNSGIRFAISEFDHPFILEQVDKHGLNLIEIGERQNVKNGIPDYQLRTTAEATKHFRLSTKSKL